MDRGDPIGLHGGYIDRKMHKGLQENPCKPLILLVRLQGSNAPPDFPTQRRQRHYGFKDPSRRQPNEARHISSIRSVQLAQFAPSAIADQTCVVVDGAISS